MGYHTGLGTIKVGCSNCLQRNFTSGIQNVRRLQKSYRRSPRKWRRAGQLCKDAGAKRVLPLPVSVPSHCALMADAATELAKELEEINFALPSVSIINNVDVAKEKTGEAIKVALIKQLYSPVRWSETIKQIVSEGITTVIEVGPGKVLQGLNKRIDKSISSVSMNSPDTVQKVQDLTNG